MAKTVSSVWAKPGAWALDAEENEAELEKQEQTQQQSDQNEAPPADFPSLSVAVSSKPKKKKGQTLSLAEFATYTKPKGNTFQPSFQSRGLTHADMLALPTGPRERTAEELERSRLGGGFRSYGGGRDRNGDDSSNSRWGSNSRAGGDETRRGGGGFRSDSSMEFAPSRADEIDNWAEGKKSSFGGGGFDRRERGGGDRGGSGGGFFDSQSRADVSDSWVSNKSFDSSEGRRFGGGGFDRERRGGFESSSGGGGFDRERRGGFESSSAGGGGFERERRGGFESHNGGRADLESWGNKRETVSVVDKGSSARPRLNLQPRTLPVTDVVQQAPAIVAKLKGSNPFGEARPREVVLAEKGQDWKKIDEHLELMKIKETTSSVGDTDESVKKSFGSGNDRINSPENPVERSWRKPESVYVRPQR